MKAVAQAADLGGFSGDPRTRNEGSAPLLPPHHSLAREFRERAAHCDQADPGQRRYLRLRGQLIVLAKLAFVDVLQNESDGFFVKRFHRANSTSAISNSTIALPLRDTPTAAL